jgi:hypothetical protein
MMNPIEFAPMHKCYNGTESYNSYSSQTRFCDDEEYAPAVLTIPTQIMWPIYT